ncbi:serine protease family [Pelomyxa schiedti]|nr:serine protease family [Pelomyxa schiedti]
MTSTSTTTTTSVSGSVDGDPDDPDTTTTTTTTASPKTNDEGSNVDDAGDTASSTTVNSNDNGNNSNNGDRNSPTSRSDKKTEKAAGECCTLVISLTQLGQPDMKFVVPNTFGISKIMDHVSHKLGVVASACALYKDAVAVSRETQMATVFDAGQEYHLDFKPLSTSDFQPLSARPSKESLVFFPPTGSPWLHELRWLSRGSAEPPMPYVYFSYVNKENPSEKSAFTILYCMDTNEDLCLIQSWLKIMVQILHVDCCAFEYTGYGHHIGVPSEAACYQDACAAYMFLATLKPRLRIIIMGKGMGSGPASHVAAAVSDKGFESKWLPKSVKLDAPCKAAMKHAPHLRSSFPSLFSTEIFNNEKLAGMITCPVLLVHGEKDTSVPLTQVQKLFSLFSYRWKLVTVRDEDHNLNIDNDECLEAIQGFLNFLDLVMCTFKSELRPPPETITGAPVNFVKTWLDQLGLGQYLNNFLSAGFYDKLSLSGLQPIDFEILQIDECHHNTILDAVTALRDNLSGSTPPPSPAPHSNQSPVSPRSTSSESPKTAPSSPILPTLPVMPSLPPLSHPAQHTGLDPYQIPQVLFQYSASENELYFRCQTQKRWIPITQILKSRSSHKALRIFTFYNQSTPAKNRHHTASHVTSDSTSSTCFSRPTQLSQDPIPLHFTSSLDSTPPKEIINTTCFCKYNSSTKRHTTLTNSRTRLPPIES